MSDLTTSSDRPTTGDLKNLMRVWRPEMLAGDATFVREGPKEEFNWRVVLHKKAPKIGDDK